MELRKLVCHPKSIFLVGEIFCFSKLSMILDKYGFERLNDFLWHEPGTNAEIQKFCRTNYGVTFQMFEKIHVKGKNQHPIYKWLSDSNANGWNDGAPTWNFCKYLIDEKGMLLKYFNMKTVPTDTVITNYLIKNRKD